MRHTRKIGAWFMTCAFVSSLAVSAVADEASGAPPIEARLQEAPHASAPVRVSLHADNPRATLERRASVATYTGVPIKDAAIAGLATWTPECTVPCETKLDLKFTYRVGGDGLVPSDSFVLPHEGGPVVLDAKMGSARERLGGLGLAVLGAGGLVLGGTALAVTPILADDNVGTSAVRTGVLVSGIAVTTLSALVFGAGLWLWSRNETTVHPNRTGAFQF